MPTLLNAIKSSSSKTDSVFDLNSLVNFKSKASKPLLSSKVISTEFDKVTNNFINTVKNSFEQRAKDVLLPLLPRIYKKDAKVTKDININILPAINNALSNLWRQGFNLGNNHAYLEINKTSNFNSSYDLAEFSNRKDLKARLAEIDKKTAKLIQIGFEYQASNKEVSPLINQELTKLETEKQKINTELELLSSSRPAKNAKPNPIENNIKRANQNDDEVIRQSQARAKEESKEKNRQKLRELLERDKIPQSTLKNLFPTVTKIREKRAKESSRATGPGPTYPAGEPIDIIRETEFGQTYLNQRNNVIAAGIKKRYVDNNTITIKNNIVKYIESGSQKRESDLLNSLVTKEDNSDKITLINSILDKNKNATENDRSTLNADEVRRIKGIISEIKQEANPDISKLKKYERMLESSSTEDELRRTKESIAEIKRDIQPNLNKLAKYQSLLAIASTEEEKLRQEKNIRVVSKRLKVEQDDLQRLENVLSEAANKSTEIFTLTTEQAKQLNLDSTEITKIRLKEKLNSLKSNSKNISDSNLYNLRRIATTEISHAYNLGRLKVFDEEGYTHVFWRSDIENQKRGVVCKVCEERANNSYAIYDVLNKDDLEIKIAAHPLCECYYELDRNKRKKKTGVIPVFDNSIAKWAVGAGAAILSTALMYEMFRRSKLNIKGIQRRVAAQVLPQLEAASEKVQQAAVQNLPLVQIPLTLIEKEPELVELSPPQIQEVMQLQKAVVEDLPRQKAEQYAPQTFVFERNQTILTSSTEKRNAALFYITNSRYKIRNVKNRIEYYRVQILNAPDNASRRNLLLAYTQEINSIRDTIEGLKVSQKILTTDTYLLSMAHEDTLAALRRSATNQQISLEVAVKMDDILLSTTASKSIQDAYKVTKEVTQSLDNELANSVPQLETIKSELLEDADVASIYRNINNRRANTLYDYAIARIPGELPRSTVLRNRLNEVIKIQEKLDSRGTINYSQYVVTRRRLEEIKKEVEQGYKKMNSSGVDIDYLNSAVEKTFDNSTTLARNSDLKEFRDFLNNLNDQIAETFSLTDTLKVKANTTLKRTGITKEVYLKLKNQESATIRKQLERKTLTAQQRQLLREQLIEIDNDILDTNVKEFKRKNKLLNFNLK